MVAFYDGDIKYNHGNYCLQIPINPGFKEHNSYKLYKQILQANLGKTSKKAHFYLVFCFFFVTLHSLCVKTAHRNTLFIIKF